MESTLKSIMKNYSGFGGTFTFLNGNSVRSLAGFLVPSGKTTNLVPFALKDLHSVQLQEILYNCTTLVSPRHTCCSTGNRHILVECGTQFSIYPSQHVNCPETHQKFHWHIGNVWCVTWPLLPTCPYCFCPPCSPSGWMSLRQARPQAQTFRFTLHMIPSFAFHQINTTLQAQAPRNTYNIHIPTQKKQDNKVCFLPCSCVK